MASNSPGTFSRPRPDIDDPDAFGIRGLLPDVNYPGKMESGYHGDMGYVMESGYYVSTSDGASTCSSSTAETWELEGAALLVLESKSLRSFTTNDEYLFAMKEDLADWFASLYQGQEITANNLFQALETGVMLCKHANKVQEFAKQSPEFGDALEMRSYFIRSVPEGHVPYREGVKPETFQARDNVSNFITWTRELGIPQVLSFETDDLVLRKNEKSVILSLLEIARVGAKLGMLAPTLVQMEQEIDAELAGEEPPPQVQIKTCDLRSLDERVRDLIGRCTCPVQFPMIKVGEGKYKIGDTRSLIFVRILRNHVMVRVGGGWDTLENYLNKHDPCQCHYRGHRSGTHRDVHKMAANQHRRSSNPNNMPTPSTLTPPTSQRQVSPAAMTSRNRSTSPQTSSTSSSPTRTVLPGNSTAPAKPASKTGNSSKGHSVLPNHNHQEPPSGPRPLPQSSSSNSISSSQPIRSSSPRLGQLKGSSTLRSAHSTTQLTSSSRTPASSSSRTPSSSSSRTPSSQTPTGRHVLTRKDQPPSNKSLTPRDTSRSLNRSSSLEEQTTSPSRPRLALEVTTTQSAQKGGITATGKSSKKADGKKTLSNFSGEEKNGRSTPLLANRSRASTASPSGSDVARFPHPKGHSPSSPVKALVQSSRYGQRTSSPGVERTGGKESKAGVSELPSHLKKALVADVACAVSDWLESTSETDVPGQSADLGKTPARPSSSVSQILTETSDKEAADKLSNQQLNTPTISIARDRPATSSRIPKPRKIFQNSKPKTTNTVSGNSLQADADPSSSHPPANISSDQTRDALDKSPSGLSSSLSSSSNEAQSGPERNKIHVNTSSERLHTHAGEPVAAPGNHSSSNSLNDSECLVGGEADAPNPELTSTYRRMSLGSRAPSFSLQGNLVPAGHRRNSADVKSPTTLLDQPSWPPRASSTSSLEGDRQPMFVNEITFSDDEEINELIKNSALQEKISESNMQPPIRPARKAARPKVKKSDEVLMIIRDDTGRHAVQLTRSEPQPISTPKSKATRTTYAGLKEANPDRSDSRRSSITSNPFPVHRKLSLDDSISNSKTLAQSKRATDNDALVTDVSPRSLEEIHALIAESKNGFLQDDIDAIHSPREKIEMYKNLEKLFRDYRETELKAAVTDSTEKESGAVSLEKSLET